MRERNAFIGFRSRLELKEEAEAEAERQQRSLSNLCEIALDYYLEREAHKGRKEKTA
jgi:hypothetical protein